MCPPAQFDSVLVQENARLRSAVAMAQQQLHEAAAAAERHALGEAAQALQGEQQAVNQSHLLVPISSLHLCATCAHPSVSQPSVRSSMHTRLACLHLCMCSWVH